MKCHHLLLLGGCVGHKEQQEKLFCHLSSNSLKPYTIIIIMKMDGQAAYSVINIIILKLSETLYHHHHPQPL